MRPPIRAGYMGHLTQVANKLQEVVRLRPEVRSLLGGNEEWQQYAATALRERNEVGCPGCFSGQRRLLARSFPGGVGDGRPCWMERRSGSSMLPSRCVDETPRSSQHLMGPGCIRLQLPDGDLRLGPLAPHSLHAVRAAW